MTDDRAMEDLVNELVAPAVARLRARVMALVFGTVCATGLFVATAWLVIRGGENVGAHLRLLDNYFPGYTVTWPGAFIGAFYAGVLGGVVGSVMAFIYNIIAARSGKD